MFSAQLHRGTAALLWLAGLKGLSWWIWKANLDRLISATASWRFHLVARVWLPKLWAVRHSLLYEIDPEGGKEQEDERNTHRGSVYSNLLMFSAGGHGELLSSIARL